MTKRLKENDNIIKQSSITRRQYANNIQLAQDMVHWRVPSEHGVYPSGFTHAGNLNQYYHFKGSSLWNQVVNGQ
jgi:hypothetical protein